jgi:hypothetical protein
MTHDWTYHDEQTMTKVWSGLEKAGLNKVQILRAVASMMNEGVLFREKATEPDFIVTYAPPPRRWAWGRRSR